MTAFLGSTLQVAAEEPSRHCKWSRCHKCKAHRYHISRWQKIKQQLLLGQRTLVILFTGHCVTFANPDPQASILYGAKEVARIFGEI